MAEEGTAALNNYTAQLYQSLMKNMPAVSYTPRSKAQIRDNLEKAYKASYDQSVQNRQQTTRQNRAAIDADAAARGMGASTWVTDAKMRQSDREASDLSTLAANKNSTIAQQLSSALSDQDDNNLSVQQYNASLRANALNNALSAATSMYDRFKTNTGSTGNGNGDGDETGNFNFETSTQPGMMKELANAVNSGRITASQYSAALRKISSAVKPKADQSFRNKNKMSGATI